MPDPIAEQIQDGIDYEVFFSDFYGLSDLDRRCFETLAEADDALTVTDVAECVNRERSTTYRSLQRLSEEELIERERRTSSQGGHHHLYSVCDPDAIADNLQQSLNDWYRQIDRLIDQYRNEYTDSEIAVSDN